MRPEPFSAGRITVTLITRQGVVNDLSLISTRPTDVSRRLFTGQPVAAMLSLLPRLFSVCATAQACAAVTACERAAAVEIDTDHARARQVLVQVETVREHLFRILVGWSQWLGRAPDPKCLAAIGRLRDDWQHALYPDGDGFALGGGRLAPDPDVLRAASATLGTTVNTVLGTHAAELLAIDDVEGFEHWTAGGSRALAPALLKSVLDHGWQAAGQCDIDILPRDTAPVLSRTLAGDGGPRFAEYPEWSGRPAETGALQRELDRPLIAALCAVYGNGLLPRLAARLTELADLPGRIETLASALATATPAVMPDAPDGEGWGQADAARGSLLHWVRLEHGRVADHRVLAPTEWNFHPRGVLATGLRNLPGGDELARQAQLLVDAVDPCVDCAIEYLESA